jgi:hypothetical protein
MSLKERIRQVKPEICDNRRQIAHVRLESLAVAENLYSLMQVFGRGHQITRNGAPVYVTKCQAVEVVPRLHTECTNEIPVSVSDPYSFFPDPDPDPEVEAGGQYGSGYGSGSNPDPGL